MTNDSEQMNIILNSPHSSANHFFSKYLQNIIIKELLCCGVVLLLLLGIPIPNSLFFVLCRFLK